MFYMAYGRCPAYGIKQLVSSIGFHRSNANSNFYIRSDGVFYTLTIC